MKRILYIAILLIVSVSAIHADTKEQRMLNRHELRFGIGDPLMSISIPIRPISSGYIHNGIIGMEASEADIYMQRHFYEEAQGEIHHTGNLFAEYQYSITHWFSVGGQFNYSAHWRRMKRYNGYGEYDGAYNKSVIDLHVIPEMRFTFFHREHCNLYAGLGAGFVAELYSHNDIWQENPTRYYINSENNRYSWVIDLTLFGVSWGGEKVFGFAEFGALLEPGTKAFVDRMFRGGIGFRFPSNNKKAHEEISSL